MLELECSVDGGSFEKIRINLSTTKTSEDLKRLIFLEQVRQQSRIPRFIYGNLFQPSHIELELQYTGSEKPVVLHDPHAPLGRIDKDTKILVSRVRNELNLVDLINEVENAIMSHYKELEKVASFLRSSSNPVSVIKLNDAIGKCTNILTSYSNMYIGQVHRGIQCNVDAIEILEVSKRSRESYAIDLVRKSNIKVKLILKVLNY